MADESAGFTRRSLALGAAGLVAGARSPGAAARDGRPYYDRARALAGGDPVLGALAESLTPGVELPRPPAPGPVGLFDNLVMLSAGWVSAMAVLTDEGIVLIDALPSPAEAESVVVAGLREVGADPRTIRYVVVTHGHEDHFGGARYFAERWGARVLMSAADRELAAGADPDRTPPRDLDIRDGQCLALGGTTLRLYLTPGHTPGTVSPVVPLRAGRERHTAMLWGGTNPPADLAGLRTYRTSVHSFRTRMRQAGVDVELSNHPNDHGLQRAELLRQRPEGPNPFVIGQRRAQRYLEVMDLMLRGRIADARAAEARKAT
ncbi:MBL fold metallo-hydrolase [Streptomyces parvulus]|uniref:MBL fold metallo-hydrolase n=1 Tax=Streptomyces parvulus TaxID=146923 RepID=UPI0036880E8A